MTKSDIFPKIKTHIENNKKILDRLTSGSTTTKRLNNINWIRHELSWTEPRTLIQAPLKEQNARLDFNNMKNIGTAYDYIIENAATPIDASEIHKIHSILCENTNIIGGTLRTTNKILQLSDDGTRFHAPDQREIIRRLNEIIYQLNNPAQDTLTRAFNAHYELIALQPFDDFNKRTARLIMNWALIHGGYRPIIFNKRSDKQKYIAAIASMAAGDRKTYMSYMTQVLKRSQDDIIKQLKKSQVK